MDHVARLEAGRLGVLGGQAVARGLVVASWFVVASGLAPRWAAQQPQSEQRRVCQA